MAGRLTCSDKDVILAPHNRQQVGRHPGELKVVVRANLVVTKQPLGDQRFIFAGSPDEIKADIAATREFGAAELFFDPTFSPDGRSVDGFLSGMAKMWERV
jgi:hypothetical protein